MLCRGDRYGPAVQTRLYQVGVVIATSQPSKYTGENLLFSFPVAVRSLLGETRSTFCRLGVEALHVI